MSIKHIVAFGGDKIATEPENKLSAEYIVGLTGKKHPRIAFIPTASGDSPAYIEAFQKRYSGFGETSWLGLFVREIKDIRSFLLSQDAIYVGGGNTANMLAIWRVHGVDKILREAYDAGIVLCGSSAGSICWFECSVTDSFGMDLSPLNDGLGFIKGSNCPHYNSEPNRQPQYHSFLRAGLAGGYAADDGAALHFEDGIFKEAIASSPDARALKVELHESEIVETPLLVRFLGDRS